MPACTHESETQSVPVHDEHPPSVQLTGQSSITVKLPPEHTEKVLPSQRVAPSSQLATPSTSSPPVPCGRPFGPQAPTATTSQIKAMRIYVLPPFPLRLWRLRVNGKVVALWCQRNRGASVL